eukprot:2590550-Karenia_brevis.AAC.1
MSTRSWPASSIDPDERVEHDFRYDGLIIPQYPFNMVAEPNSAAAAASSNPYQPVEFEEKMMKVVAIT